MPDEPLQQKARTEYLAVRDSLYVLGSATLADIAAACGLSAQAVSRRLHNAGPNCCHPSYRRFNFDKLSGKWALTAGARQEAERGG